MLNRCALIVRPRQPFIDWATALDADSVAPDPQGEQMVYLVPEFDDEDGAREVLEQVYAHVFQSELYSWWTDEDDWPADRSLAAFEAWFAVEFHTIVVDLVDAPLEVETLEAAGPDE